MDQDIETAFIPSLSYPHAPIFPSIQNLGSKLRVGGATLLCFLGPANKAVEWRIVMGLGTLTPLTLFTDAFGRATCKFEASALAGTVEVGVVFVP